MSVGHDETTEIGGKEAMFVRSSNVVMAGGCIRCQRIAWPWGGLVVATVELAVILLAAKARRRSSSGSAAFGRRSSSSSEVQRHDAGAGGGNAGIAVDFLTGAAIIATVGRGKAERGAEK